MAASEGGAEPILRLVASDDPRLQAEAVETLLTMRLSGAEVSRLSEVLLQQLTPSCSAYLVEVAGRVPIPSVAAHIRALARDDGSGADAARSLLTGRKAAERLAARRARAAAGDHDAIAEILD